MNAFNLIPCSFYCTVPYYTILYYTLLYCTILYCTILYTILYYTIYYTVLYSTTLCYAILYYTMLYYTMLYYSVLYYAILYYTMLYCTILYCTILYNTAVATALLDSTHFTYSVPLYCVASNIVVAAMTTKFAHYDMIKYGGYVSAASPFFLVIATQTWAVVMFVVTLSLGEAIWSPRTYDYTMSIAPEVGELSYHILLYYTLCSTAPPLRIL